MLPKGMASTHLDIESHVRNATGVVRVQGEIDLDNVEQLVEAVLAATPPGGSVEIDLREVGFIDSAGVAGLNRCRRQALRVEADIMVVCLASSPVARLLQWTGLARVLDVRSEPGG